ncbi:MAG: methyltransferase domain-containing protein [archaeon]
MRKDLLERLPLVCPGCRRPGKVARPNIRLASITKSSGKFIIKGKLKCTDCGRKYEINGGVVCIIDRKRASRFVSKETVSSYLHASYGFYPRRGKIAAFGGNEELWGKLRKEFGAESENLPSIDLGCGMGRSTFELAKKSSVAVGLDADFQALLLAAKFSRTGKIEYDLKIRGLAKIPVKSGFLPSNDAAFVLADARAPPFPKESFRIVCACNLIDSIGSPSELLRKMDSLLIPGGTLVVASPFSWREEVTARKQWLETKELEGIDYLSKVLRGRLLPGLGLRYSITGKERGIEWSFWTGRMHVNTFFTDILSARKSMRRFSSPP